MWRAKATGSPELAQHIAALDGVLVAQLDVATEQRGVVAVPVADHFQNGLLLSAGVSRDQTAKDLG